MPLIELGVGAEWNKEQDWHTLCEASAKAGITVSAHASLLKDDVNAEISIKLSDNDEVQELNKTYRGKDKPTNVLSFPSMEKEHLASLSYSKRDELLLGDIILAKTTCQNESQEKAIPLIDHVSHLVVHGTLHLLGYDHQDSEEAETMEQLEVQALLTLGIANPYNDKH